MKGLNKKIQMHFDGLVNELKRIGGECIITWRDYECDNNASAVMVLSPETTICMFEELFSRHPYLIPKALAALAMVTDDYDFDDDDDDDDDDPDDEPDDGDGVPVDECATEYEMCMN